jgi:hypothetical protein
MATVRSLKEVNERLMRAHAKHVELNVVLLQILSKIQKHLQQGPSNARATMVREVENPFECPKA